MSQDSERVKKLIGFKEKLEKRITTLDTELKEAQAMLETINSMLLEKGFKRIEITKESTAKVTSAKQEIPVESEPSAPETMTASENVLQLKTSSGELLAILHVTENSLIALPAEDKNFSVNTPPFNQFLVERVLAKMQERDSELARAGQLSPDRIFSYSIIREGDVVREISVKNVDAERLRELKSSIRWTFEKMYEKMQAQT